MIRSILSVLAGIAALTITSFAIEAVANPLMLRMFPAALPNEAAINFNSSARLFMYAYSTLCVVFGGYVTAWIAQRSQVVHAVAMGVIEVGLTALAMMSFRDKAPMQVWIISMLFTVPATFCGGFLRAQTGKRA